MPAHFARDQIDGSILPVHHRCLEVDDAVAPEVRHSYPSLRVEHDEPKPERHVQNPLVVPVGPVGQPPTRQPAGSRLAAGALALTVHPQELTGFRVQCHHGSPRATGRVEHAVRNERSAFQLELGPAAEVVGLKTPRDLEVVEVGGVDLVEWRVPGVAQVPAVGGPCAVGGGRQVRRLP